MPSKKTILSADVTHSKPAQIAFLPTDDDSDDPDDDDDDGYDDMIRLSLTFILAALQVTSYIAGTTLILCAT